VDPVLLYPDPPPPDVVRALEMAGCSWEAGGASSASDDLSRFAGAVVAVDEDPAAAIAYARSVRQGAGLALLLVVRGGSLSELDSHHDLFDDFCVAPFHPVEFELRLKHLLVAGGAVQSDEQLLSYQGLLLNLETYQAMIEGRPLDLTYMEYALLAFLVGRPGRVFTRETLLSQVWGYEYYGGARTVDVHVRRLRAKLGEEHAGLIQTVRSVGYRFGESQWTSA